ncbi:VOC family protein [Pyruvatibacter sp.]|uniref:VOC family protein n=1 Tax=Pyruvatibacter sp. TaxID=1981328 RepID=UPI0032F0462F
MPSPNKKLHLSAYITVKGAADAIAFYAAAFGAVENYRLEDPDSGRIGHSEISIGTNIVMISDEYPDFGAVSPDTLGGTPVKLHLYVEDVDAVFAQATKAGATELRPLKDEFHGDRTGTLMDPFGHIWMLASRVEEVTPAQMQKRWQEMMGG